MTTCVHDEGGAIPPEVFPTCLTVSIVWIPRAPRRPAAPALVWLSLARLSCDITEISPSPPIRTPALQSPSVCPVSRATYNLSLVSPAPPLGDFFRFSSGAEGIIGA